MTTSPEYEQSHLHCYRLTAGDPWLVGWVQVHEISPQVIEVVDVFVKEEFRRRGYARRLLEEVIARANSANVTVIQAHSNPDNEAACALFSAVGFTIRDQEYHLELHLDA